MALFLSPFTRATDANDNPLSGAKLYFYQTGSLVLADVYTTSALSVAHANPVVADAGGKFAPIYLDPSVIYRVVLKTSAGGDLGYDVDPYSGDFSLDGTFLKSAASAVTTTANRVRTAGYSAIGEGAADYIYDAAVDAAYVTANPRTSFRTANGRGYRLDPQQPLTIQMFGGKADGTITRAVGYWVGTIGATNNAPALEAALEFVDANYHAVGSDNYFRGAPPIRFPAADGVYDFTTTVDVRSTVRLVGDGVGHPGGVASALRWPAGQHGLVLLPYNADDSGAISPAAFGGDGVILEGLYLTQHETGNNFLVDDYHAVWARVRLTMRDCGFTRWSGNGAHIVATVGGGGSLEGNANNFSIENCFFYGNENGVYLDGGDANAGILSRVDASSNRKYGVWDSSFLGNTMVQCHTDANGIPSAKNSGGRSSVSSFGGNRYYVIAGQASGASTNAPSGTSADNTWWGYIGAGGASSTYIAWTSGLTWVEGGGYRTDAAGNARTLLLGCYSESGQGVSQFVYPTLVIGGLHAAGNYGSHAELNHSISGATLSSSLSVASALKVNGTQVVGPQAAAIADITVTATSGSLPTANGSVTIADAATPTVVELLEYCRELEAKVEATLAAARTHGLIAT